MRMLKSLYGMPVSSILYYKKSEKDIEGIGFEVNPYDILLLTKWNMVSNKHSHGMSMI